MIYSVAYKAERLLGIMRNNYMIWILLNWVVVLCVYVEDGFYVGAPIAIVIGVAVSTISPAYLFLQLLQPYFRLTPDLNSKRFSFWFQLGIVVWNVGNAVIVGVAASLSRDPSYQSTYNLLMIIWLMFLGVCHVAFTVVLAIFLTLLIKLIRKSQLDMQTLREEEPGEASASKPKHTRMRLVEQQQQPHGGESRTAGAVNGVTRLENYLSSVKGLVPFGLINFVVGISFLSVQNLPYLWILWMVWCVCLCSISRTVSLPNTYV